MFRSYVTTALRSIRRYKGYAFINIFGLAVGLAACLLIGLYVRFELSYDRMHEKADRIVRVEGAWEGGEGGQPGWSAVSMPIGPLLEENMPAVVRTARVSNRGPQAVQYESHKFYEDRFRYTEPAFFEVFDFSPVSGNIHSLDRPYTVFVSESTAQKYFPDGDPIGKILETGDTASDSVQKYEVVGVFKDMPVNVHFHADFLASLSTILENSRGREWSTIANTYALLREDAVREKVESNLASFVTDQIPPPWTERTSLILRPLLRIHLYSEFGGELEPQGDIRYVWIFSAIAALILLIACINYMNLATARSAQRSREVGVRKVVGAHRGQLIWQFMSESFLFASFALIGSIGLAQLALPAFSAILDRPLALHVADLDLVAYLVMATLLVGVLSGSYPALLLSRMKPVGVLKGTGAVRSNVLLRKSLVVFQFIVSMSLIVGTIVIDRQLEFVKQAKLGFEKEQMLILPTKEGMGDKGAAFKQKLQDLSSVADVSLAYAVPGRPGSISFYEKNEIDDYDGDMMVMVNNRVDFDYIRTLGIDVLQGRSFDNSFVGDPEHASMLNETAVHDLGWDDPVGKMLGGKEIIGVFADFHFESMKSEIKPMILNIAPSTRNTIVRLNTADLPSSLRDIEQVWNTFIPGLPFQYYFLDDEYDAMYRSEQRLASLFESFAFFAIIVAALGLFGLTAFTAQQRTKEIGIRKVLGASVSSLVMMLSKDFVQLVLVAFVVAAPLAFFAMEDWLSAFAYRITIGPGIFAISGLLALVIALGTVSWQAARAATADPVKSLRTE